MACLAANALVRRMDESLNPERRRQERRWRDRRRADHPVFLDTRLPSERRAGERRGVPGETAENGPPESHDTE
jgi:hypothetical protein